MNSDLSTYEIVGLIVAIVLGLVLIGLLMTRSYWRRCPNCGIRFQRTKFGEEIDGHVKISRWMCIECSHIWEIEGLASNDERLG